MFVFMYTLYLILYIHLDVLHAHINDAQKCKFNWPFDALNKPKLAYIIFFHFLKSKCLKNKK